MHWFSDSSAIRRIDYEAGELSVWFTSGEHYVYFGVPEKVYEAFLAADSKGGFFAEHIRPRYRFAHLHNA